MRIAGRFEFIMVTIRRLLLIVPIVGALIVTSCQPVTSSQPVTVNAVPTAVPGAVPSSELDITDAPKYVVVNLDWTTAGVKLNWDTINIGYPPARNGPPKLEVRLLDYGRELVETFNIWDPLLLETFSPEEGYSWVKIPKATIEIMFPFALNLKTMQLTNTETNERLLEVDLEDTFQRYCMDLGQGDSDCLPDLAPMFSGPSAEVGSIQIGQTTDIYVKVKNLGGKTAPQDYNLWLAVMSSISDLDTLVYSYPATIVEAVDPGETTTEVMPLMVPADTMPGTYFLLAHVDPEITFMELDKDNNIFTREILVIP